MAYPGEDLVGGLRGVRGTGPVGVDDEPVEPTRVTVPPVQGRCGAVEPVEVPDQGLHPGVAGVVQAVPLQLTGEVPLGDLAELGAHEQQLLARMRPHPAVEGPHVRQPCRVVGAAGHPAVHRPLAVHHLVMADRQDECLGEGVGQPEGQLVVVEPPVQRIAAEVGQRVIHPAEVPLVVEAQPGGAPVSVRRPGDAGEGGGFLGDHRGARELCGGLRGRVPQHVDALVVLASALVIGHPLAGATGVVPPHDRGDGVHPQPVEVVLVEPVEGVGGEVVRHLRTPVVEDPGRPVRVEAAARVEVLVEGGTVEPAEAVGVGGEVAGHPVGEHSQSPGMGGVHEEGEVLRRAVAVRRCVQSDRLVAPGPGEGVLRDRKYLDMGEAQVGDIVDEVHGQLPVGQWGAVGVPAPGPQVDLEDAHRPVAVTDPRCGRVGTAGDPRGVLPVVDAETTHHRAGRRGGLGTEPHRIGLLRQLLPVRVQQVVLVHRPLAQAGQEQFPHSGRATQPHRMGRRVPGVVVSDHTHPGGLRGPHREVDAVDPLVRRHMRPEDLPQSTVCALAQQVLVSRPDDRAEAVRVLADLGGPFAVADARPGHAQPVVGQDVPGEDAGGVRERGQVHLVGVVDHRDRGRAGDVHHDMASVGGRAEHGEGVAQGAGDDVRGILGGEVATGGRAAGHSALLTSQIFSMYSRIDRSEEKKPIRATLTRALRCHCAVSR